LKSRETHIVYRNTVMIMLREFIQLLFLQFESELDNPIRVIYSGMVSINDWLLVITDKIKQ